MQINEFIDTLSELIESSTGEYKARGTRELLWKTFNLLEMKDVSKFINLQVSVESLSKRNLAISFEHNKEIQSLAINMLQDFKEHTPVMNGDKFCESISGRLAMKLLGEYIIGYVRAIKSRVA